MPIDNLTVLRQVLVCNHIKRVSPLDVLSGSEPQTAVTALQLGSTFAAANFVEME